MSLALLFPGQGSQHVGMGRALADAEPEAARVFALADEVLGYPLSKLMWSGPEEDLRDTRNAQPAILAHSVAVLRVLRARLGPVAFAAGHSLGELSAYVAAGTLAADDALSCVRARGELMHQAGTERPGAMAAVLGLSDEEVEEVCARVDAGVCVPANFNSSGQVVVSGDLAGVEQATALVKAAGAKRVMPLNVSGAFHSPLMEPAAQGLRRRLEAIDLRDPEFPVVSNATAEPVTAASEARELLVRQLTAPVRWSASIGTMRARGVGRFVEIGPGNVLCGLNRKNAEGVPCASVGEPVDLERLEDANGTT